MASFFLSFSSGFHGKMCFFLSQPSKILSSSLMQKKKKKKKSELADPLVLYESEADRVKASWSVIMEERTDWEDAILVLCVWSWLRLWVRCLEAGNLQDMQHIRQKDNISGCIRPSCIAVMDISLIFFLETFSCLRACRPRVFFSVSEKNLAFCALSQFELLFCLCLRWLW